MNSQAEHTEKRVLQLRTRMIRYTITQGEKEASPAPGGTFLHSDSSEGVQSTSDSPLTNRPYQENTHQHTMALHEAIRQFVVDMVNADSREVREYICQKVVLLLDENHERA